MQTHYSNIKNNKLPEGSTKNKNIVFNQKVQFKDNRPEAIAQLKAQQMANPTIQRQENKTGMPDNLKSGIENLSGLDMSDVKVHYNSSQPVQLQAHAFAQGNQIHIASGQEKHLPHEAWHVVQQKQGRVAPTRQLKGKVNINDDNGLEREADLMGGKALLMKDDSKANQSPFLKLESTNSKTVQRYLIVGDHDYTDDVNIQGAALPGVVAGVLGQAVAALAPPHFVVGTLENTMHIFLQADAGGLVTRQLTKWVEDLQGQPRADGKGTPAFGRKQQARVFDNYADLGRALYGWVKAKPGRRQEKALANDVYASPLIDAQINNVLTQIKTYVDGHANSAAILAALNVNNPAPAAARWAQYRSWFNHSQVGLGLQLPGNYYTVLTNPSAYSLREKVATLHDVMIYMQQHQQLDNHLPAKTATTLAGRAAYVRPQSSAIHRNSVARAPVANVAAARLAGTVRSGVEEQHETYKYARTHDIPMWGRHSGTAARMVALTQQAGGSNDEMMAVADATMAFWRKDYDHRSIAYHTLHEIQDHMPDFGFAYNPLTRYADMQDRLDLIRTLMARLTVVANSPNWANKGFKLFDDNITPDSILEIRLELARAHTDADKLKNIRDEIQGKTGVSLTRKATTQSFYRILNNIPNNVNLFMAGGTPQATNRTIALQLQIVRRELQAFNP